MSTFVLVHGGWHAAWCWVHLVPLLESAGHRVLAPDLPGHGADATPLSAKPYEMYVPKVIELLDDIQDRAIVVGHSSGGMIVTEAFRRRSEQIRALVYLSAFLLPSGKTPRHMMQMNCDSLLQTCLEVDTTKGVSVVRKECAKNVFYGDCSDEAAAWAVSRLQPEPLIPPTTLSTDTDGEGDPSRQPRRFYIECLEDRALTPRTQQWMYKESRCDTVYSLQTSHSPFLSAPAALAQCLLEIERSVSQI